MGSVYRPKLKSGRPSTIWWVKYYVNGRPVRESAGTEKETNARRFLKERDGARGDGRIVYVPADLKPSLVAQVERVRALERQTGPIIPYLFPHFAGQHWGERIKDFVRRWRTA